MNDKVLVMERTLAVPVGGGAQMVVPRSEWLWSLRYGQDQSAPPTCNDRMIAAGVCESFRYLLMECTKEEAWSRIKTIRAAIREHDTTEG